MRIASDRANPGMRREQVASELRRQGIGCGIYYPVPLHLQPVYAPLGGKPGDLPEAERAAQEVLSLPVFPEMTLAQVQRVATAVRAALSNA